MRTLAPSEMVTGLVSFEQKSDVIQFMFLKAHSDSMLMRDGRQAKMGAGGQGLLMSSRKELKVAPSKVESREQVVHEGEAAGIS